jgi:serine/threonine protein phosphatase PrpC
MDNASTDVGTDRGVGAMPGERSLLRVCGATDIGLKRKQNQDTFVIADLQSGEVSCPCMEVSLSLEDRGGYLLMVCDGMGGAAAGDVAARIATASIKQVLVAAGDEIAAHPGESLGDAVAVANRAILKEARVEPTKRGMGTTCTAAIVLPDTLTIAQVGDSRAYLLRDNELVSLTKDQSLAAQLVEDGLLTPEQLLSFRYRNVLLQALGTTAAVEPVISQYRLRAGDRVLICSDGLHGLIPESQIKNALSARGDLTSTIKALVNLALEAGGDDNVTAVVAEYGAPAVG